MTENELMSFLSSPSLFAEFNARLLSVISRFVIWPGFIVLSVLWIDPGIASLNPILDTFFFVENDREISMVILPFRCFKKGSHHLLVKVCAQMLVNCLEDLACPGKV